MKTIQQLLDAKGHDIYQVSPDASVFEAIEEMAMRSCGALLVMDGDKAVGIVSERDYARKVILQGRSSKETRVRDIMSAELIAAKPDQTIADGMSMMTSNRIRHLPVLDGERVVGMLSIGDLLKETMSAQKTLIEQLEQYINT